MAAITGLHHLALRITADHYDCAMKFYTELLGLPVLRIWEGGAMVNIGNTILEILADGARTDHNSGSLEHFAFCCDDIDGMTAKCEAAGYKVHMVPTDIVIGSEPPFPARISFVVGPNQELIEFFCEK